MPIASTLTRSKTVHSSSHYIARLRERAIVSSEVSTLNAIFRDLQRRGCLRTSFEFARLLYALDPWTDPHGSLLHLDYLAIKAGMTQWLIDLWDVFEPEVRKDTVDTKSPYVQRIMPNLLPGIAYSHALALFIHEGDNVRYLFVVIKEPQG